MVPLANSFPMFLCTVVHFNYLTMHFFVRSLVFSMYIIDNAQETDCALIANEVVVCQIHASLDHRFRSAYREG